MPERKTVQRARRAKRQGKRASTQAGEYVKEEIHHVRSGKHGAKNAKQAVAIRRERSKNMRAREQPTCQRAIARIPRYFLSAVGECESAQRPRS